MSRKTKENGARSKEVKKIAHVCTVQKFKIYKISLFSNKLNTIFLILQEQASIGCHLPICTVSQTKLEVGISLLHRRLRKNEVERGRVLVKALRYFNSTGFIL